MITTYHTRLLVISSLIIAPGYLQTQEAPGWLRNAHQTGGGIHINLLLIISTNHCYISGCMIVTLNRRFAISDTHDLFNKTPCHFVKKSTNSSFHTNFEIQSESFKFSVVLNHWLTSSWRIFPWPVYFHISEGWSPSEANSHQHHVYHQIVSGSYYHTQGCVGHQHGII